MARTDTEHRREEAPHRGAASFQLSTTTNRNTGSNQGGSLGSSGAPEASARSGTTANRSSRLVNSAPAKCRPSPGYRFG